MLGVDSEIGTSALRLWVTAGSAALLVVLCGLTFVLPTTRTAEAVRAILVAVGAVLGAAITWASFGGSSNASVERRALELRVAELTARTLAPGSPLACLDALAGEKVETACEKAIFASPESVASATSYVAARLALLSDITAYAGRNGAAIDAVQPLRRALETDRFGFLAHVLAVRDSCTSENCKALALLRDPSQVRTNLREATFNHYLESYLPIWAKASEPPVAEAPQVQAAAPAAPANASGPRKIVNIDFPTAASIPAVNIMNPEPTGPVLPGAAAAAAANPNSQSAAPASSRRSHKPAANPPAPAAVQRPRRASKRRSNRSGRSRCRRSLRSARRLPRRRRRRSILCRLRRHQTQTPLQRRAGNELSGASRRTDPTALCLRPASRAGKSANAIPRFTARDILTENQ